MEETLRGNRKLCTEHEYVLTEKNTKVKHENAKRKYMGDF